MCVKQRHQKRDRRKRSLRKIEGERVRQRERGKERERKRKRERVGVHVIIPHVHVRVTIFATEGTVILYCTAVNLFLMKCQNKSSGPQIQL